METGSLSFLRKNAENLKYWCLDRTGKLVYFQGSRKFQRSELGGNWKLFVKNAENSKGWSLDKTGNLVSFYGRRKYHRLELGENWKLFF